jgi:ADP-heptose:LPS heptosyltransferase
MQKNLIIQLARFGDLIQTKRLAYSVNAQSETHLCIDISLEALARIIYPPDSGFVLHTVRAHGQASASEVLDCNAALFSRLSKENFTTVYNCNSSGMNTAIAALFAPERVRGLRNDSGQPLRERWMQMAFRLISERRIAPLNLMDYWGLFAPDPISPEQVNPMATPGGRGLGVVLAGRMARRSLPPEVLAPIVRTGAATLPGHKRSAPVFLLGTDAEKPLARDLIRLLPSSILADIADMTGKTDWSGLCDALRGLDALIAPDTGTMHLAAHLGVPVLAFFLSSAWAWETGPYGLGHRVYQAVQPCLPCVETQKCALNTACLEPFKNPALLRGLAGRNNDTGQGIQGIFELRSAFDALGLSWEGSAESQSKARDDLRGLIAEYAQIALFCSSTQTEGAAAFLYRERDWMLPGLVACHT